MSIGPDLLETTSAAAAGDTRRLTTVTNVKAIIGETGSTYDTILASMIDRVSDMAARDCNLAADSAGAFPTFGAETLRATWNAYGGERDDILLLPWRPKISVSSVVENGVTLTANTDYRVINGNELQRISDSVPTPWDESLKVVVTFTAGWSLASGVPPALEAGVIEQVKAMFYARDRDPALRSNTTERVGSNTYSVPGGDSIGENGLLGPLVDALAPYRRKAL